MKLLGVAILVLLAITFWPYILVILFVGWVCAYFPGFVLFIIVAMVVVGLAGNLISGDGVS